MPKEVVRLGVVGSSYPPTNRWAARVLRPVAAMADLPQIAQGTPMSERDGIETVYMGDHALVLHSNETGHYIDNLQARQPSIWVAVDDGVVRVITVDPYEGEALASDPERIVEAVPLPPQLAARMEAFITAHHVEQVFHKRKRVPATSAEDPRAPRILQADEKWVNTRGRSGRGPGGRG
ncbi:DUF3305 domain-containing protein [Aestuariivita sp.]|jgi:hypothetical protein|uniref:DUF3305 domain-containing protein n=1 Tax=Aestuariivita sp. TaxID=1872407 RepID=UPI00216BFA86|nr:DUF3305 domain-containing protein [Aestuariivita sp.]MCE8008465.1 DUF3305 domain-containing protein [Aestuariivita sp.]